LIRACNIEQVNRQRVERFFYCQNRNKVLALFLDKFSYEFNKNIDSQKITKAYHGMVDEKENKTKMDKQERPIHCPFLIGEFLYQVPAATGCKDLLICLTVSSRKDLSTAPCFIRGVLCKFTLPVDTLDGKRTFSDLRLWQAMNPDIYCLNHFNPLPTYLLNDQWFSKILFIQLI